LVRELAALAWEQDLESVEFQLVEGVQDAAIEAVVSLGAYPIGRLADYVQEEGGTPHDLVFFRIAVANYFRF
jgi:hypothetical protein